MDFLKSVWYTLIAYALILAGAVAALYHLLSRPVVLGIVAGLVITGLLLLGVRRLVLRHYEGRGARGF